MIEKSNQVKTWRVIAILDSGEVDTFATRLERAMNQLEDDGYVVEKPKPVGKHYFVYGRLPHVVVKGAPRKGRRKRGNGRPSPPSASGQG